MFSKFTIAIGLAVIADLAVAKPIRRDPIYERQAPSSIIEEQKAPWYCQVIGNERAAFDYAYQDVSKDCQDAGLANECCITIMKQGPKRPLIEQDRNDLMAAIAGQSKKDGRFDRTRYGDWTATFDTIGFTDNTLVNSEILQVWFNAIKKLDLATTSGFGNVVLQIMGGTDNVSNYMVVSRKAT